MSKTNALEQEIGFLSSQNEDLQEQLRELKRDVIQLLREKNDRIGQLERHLSTRNGLVF